MHPALAQFRRPGPSMGPRSAGELAQEVPAIDAADSNSLVMEIFYSRRDMASLAVIDNDRPIGLINRDIFLSQMSKPFHRELYDKKSCIAFMDKEPLIVDAEMSIEALTFKTVEVGEKALVDGFIVTREGRFAGVGNGLRLLSIVAEMQAEKNRQIMQSIEYASVIQQAMLRASRETLGSMLPDAALLWEPRDVVGGDFYHFAAFPDGWFGAVADCTGHGVPGAFMTLLASASLSQALEQLGPRNPCALLAAVNRNVKALLGQIHGAGDAPQSNDGLDAAFFWFDAARQQLQFAGARVALHVLRPAAPQFESIAGDRMGVGYVDSLADYAWAQHAVDAPQGSLLFVSTDGLTDQIGGPRKIAFGKRRALDQILERRDNAASSICASLLDALADWQGKQARRDDVTLFFARV
ncbi:serine phosphatase RsbU (regulator of sigma subunit) [Paraburkholderia unamae]|uniref:Serine phosphatase RsbU (Regulator of sigma subunit) n=2 Tax=Paraburkholderia unamae TaxID=219649 RepID=A0ABX5KSJ8_9BURK|nr:SpoIIE family protein phosphatase [Paraburkholderia unamae]PVX85047.1 serine phosphatase RsbU (regulator of sigma subunit) [Paraburkholderia unamae]RAR65861.1 serine phosphatase RsbU (regulator of sigma subunit) [Paraburkholderia unamae]CAG9275144.1 Serine phosphatase RsbU (Regulator of sigma subunit) [Paraburkholderia unamae]